MDEQGKNKQIEQQIPGAGAGVSSWPRSSNVASPFTNLSPSNLSLPLPLLLPRTSSHHNGLRKPYSMAHVGGVGSSSRSIAGARTLPFQQPYIPLSMRGAYNNVDLTDQIRPSFQNLSLGSSTSADLQAGTGSAYQVRQGRDVDHPLDPKKLRRVMSNRNSAYKARVKKLMNTCDKEKEAENLETVVAVLTSKIALESENKSALVKDQQELNQQIAACANYMVNVDAEINEKRALIIRLRQRELTQQQQKFQQQQTKYGVWDHGHLTVTGQMMNPYLNPVDAGVNTTNVDLLNQLYLKQQQQENLGQVSMPGWVAGQGQQSNVMAGAAGWDAGQGQQPNVMTGAGWEDGQGQQPNVMDGAGWEPSLGQQTNVMDGAGWEPGLGQQTNVGLEQSGAGQEENPSLNQWQEQQNADNLTSTLAELEEILNIDFDNVDDSLPI